MRVTVEFVTWLLLYFAGSFGAFMSLDFLLYQSALFLMERKKCKRFGE